MDTLVDDVSTVLGDLVEIARAEPERTNPSYGASCAYQTPEDPDDNCLIGRFARLNGWSLPPYDSTSGVDRSLVEEFGWPVSGAVAEALRIVQKAADGWDGTVAKKPLAADGSHLPPWGSVADWIEATRLTLIRQAECNADYGWPK